MNTTHQSDEVSASKVTAICAAYNFSCKIIHLHAANGKKYQSPLNSTDQRSQGKSSELIQLADLLLPPGVPQHDTIHSAHHRQLRWRTTHQHPISNPQLHYCQSALSKPHLLYNCSHLHVVRLVNKCQRTGKITHPVKKQPSRRTAIHVDVHRQLSAMLPSYSVTPSLSDFAITNTVLTAQQHTCPVRRQSQLSTAAAILH